MSVSSAELVHGGCDVYRKSMMTTRETVRCLNG